ncbi:MAG: carboxyl transferase domain-containing protein [Actinomycetota bacterium]
MTVLNSVLDTSSEEFAANVAAMEEHLVALESLLDQAKAGGGEKYVDRHKSRGKLLARERIEFLIDRDSAFLELSPVAGAHTEYNVGAGVVTGVGVVENTECMIVASDPTDKGGAINPIGLAKGLRALEIAAQNRLPVVYLVESAGGDLPRQIDVFLPGGKTFRELTRLSAAGVPTISLVFGSSTAGGAYLPGMSDYTVFVEGRAKVFLGGPPLVKMATGEDSTDEELGGAEMHATTSGLADFMAVDERDAIRLGRMIVSRLNWRKQGGGPSAPVVEPVHDPEELLGVASADLKVPFDINDVIARIVDGSEFDEFKPMYGTSLVTGWARIHGFDVGILANHRGILFSEESQKATQFIQLANRSDTPLLFIQNVTGFMVGASYEQGGIVKHGSMMINAVSNSTVPHLTLQVGGSYGAGNYAMAGRPYDPRFVFVWPNAKTCIMGAEQLAGTLSIVARAAAERTGVEFDDEADVQRRTMITMKITQEEQATYLSGRVLDDGIIDPRDSRTVLGIALSAVHNGDVAGTDRFGVFRM